MEQTQLVILDKKHFEALELKVNNIYDLLLNSNILHLNSDRVFSNKEAADYLKVCNKTLQNYRDDGLIEYSQYGRKISFTQSNLDDYLERNKKELFKKQLLINLKNSKNV